MDQMKELVSIVVPVYNVGEELLKRCVESLLGQTYENIEIILVDDGSTDTSGEMCDKCLSYDSRISVVHRPNGGLSVARNTGTEKASGKYIAYVDSDDWIEADMIARLLEAIVNSDSDMSICGIISTDSKRKEYLPWFDESCVLNRKDAYAELIRNEKITSHAWNKLYKSEIIRKFPFPEGKLYEDIRMMHGVFLSCEKIAIVKEHLYNYFRRSESISTTSKLYNKIEFSNACKDRYEFVRKYTPEYSDIVLAQMAGSISLSLVQYRFSESDIFQHEMELREIRAFLNEKNVRKAVLENSSRSIQMYYFLAAALGYRSNILYRRILKRFTNRYKKWN